MTAATGGAFVADIVGGGIQSGKQSGQLLDSSIQWCTKKDDTSGLKTSLPNAGSVVLNPRLSLKVTLDPFETDSPLGRTTDREKHNSSRLAPEATREGSGPR